MTLNPPLAGEDRQPITGRSANTSKRILDPIERTSEVWFGLIMVLTFTCSLSVKEAGRDEVRQMFFAALGCNVAWGILDAFMYLLSSFVERGRGLSMLRAVRRAPNAEGAYQVISDALPPMVAASLPTAAFETVR